MSRWIGKALDLQPFPLLERWFNMIANMVMLALILLAALSPLLLILILVWPRAKP